MKEETIIKLVELNRQANNIFTSDLQWKDKYEMIFNDDISVLVNKMVTLEYYDPDTTYEEDVTAFMNAFNKKISELKKLIPDTDTDLKPCPFCGGKGERHETPHDDIDIDYFIRCISCGAEGGWSKVRAGAVTHWNRRV